VDLRAWPAYPAATSRRIVVSATVNGLRKIRPMRFLLTVFSVNKRLYEG
jgi:hypothetical protein